MTGPVIISTERLDLVPATIDMLRADLVGDGSVAGLLNAAMPADWPVEHWDAGPMNWCISKLIEHAGDTAALAWWSPRYVVLRDPKRSLIGTCGFKGPPTTGETGSPPGEVELGYGIIPSQRRRGLATEATLALVQWARLDARVRVIVGQTLGGEAGVASQGVLRRAGFMHVGRGSDPDEPEVERFELRARR